MNKCIMLSIAFCFSVVFITLLYAYKIETQAETKVQVVGTYGNCPGVVDMNTIKEAATSGALKFSY